MQYSTQELFTVSIVWMLSVPGVKNDEYVFFTFLSKTLQEERPMSKKHLYDKGVWLLNRIENWLFF